MAAIGWPDVDLDGASSIEDQGLFATLVKAPLLQAARAGAALIVLPERSFQEADATEPPWWLTQLCALARAQRVCIAVGYVDQTHNENRLLFIDARGRVVGRYTKTHLIQGEDYHPGNGTLVLLDCRGVTVGGMICQDDNFTDLSRRYGRAGALVVAVPTWEYPSVFAEPHLQSSTHRAIESRYVVVRAVRDGISAIIDQQGQVLAERNHLRQGAGVIVADVALRRYDSLFNRWGNWFVVVCALYLVVWATTHVIRRRRTLAGSR